jgi:hypothetical protein
MGAALWLGVGRSRAMASPARASRMTVQRGVSDDRRNMTPPSARTPDPPVQGTSVDPERVVASTIMLE